MINRKNFTLLSAPPRNELTGVYTIDRQRSTVGFSARHALFSSAQGQFTSFEGLLKINGRAFGRSEAYISVQTDSVETGSFPLNAQITGPDFLDSSTFPLMSFRSSGVLDANHNLLHLAGYLRIKDIELPVPVELEFNETSPDRSGDNRINFQATVTLQRSDWGLDWNTNLASGGGLISEKVKLHLNLSAVRLDPAQAA
ncbi:YceI family protein [Streptomyces sp. NPDC127036]|uniref:YceI family protein n=1 Tax=Streptomyces sp. NPDC127036 TaxID=3347112 RepID=UPI003668D500